MSRHTLIAALVSAVERLNATGDSWGVGPPKRSRASPFGAGTVTRGDTEKPRTRPQKNGLRISRKVCEPTLSQAFPILQGPTGVLFLKPSPNCYRRIAIMHLRKAKQRNGEVKTLALIMAVNCVR